MSRFTCASLLFLSAVSPVAADGLVFALPEDRTAAVYEMELAFEQAGKKIIRPGSVKLASVGRAEVAGVQLRWLEITIDAAEENGKYRMIYKALIPEKALQEGGSPVECILKCWWTRKIREKDAAKELKAELMDKHPHDEQWGYLPTFILTGAMTAKKRLAAVETDTIFGKAPCVGVSGKFDYEQETRLWQTTVETRLHPKAPFGVVSSRVAFQMERRGEKFTGLATFKLTEVIRNYDGELMKYR
jgi:hypothetical protein